jgi:pyruvate dehydrogenase E1 component beta subunit
LIKDEVPDEDYTVPFGRLRAVRDGGDVTLVAWSAAVVVAEQTADLAAEEGISCQVIDLRTLVPLDVAGLGEAVAGTGRAVVIHEAPLTAGFGAEVVATIVEEAFSSLTAPVLRVAAPDAPYPISSLERDYLPSAERALGAVRRVIGVG